MDDDREERFQPGFVCWSCRRRLSVSDLLRDGILRSRASEEGGPYRLFDCRICQVTNLCESTPKGRWFGSPAFRPSLVDYVLGRVFLSQPEVFLKACAWYRDHEARRRYHFEADGDRRYSRGSFLRRLWSRGTRLRPERLEEPTRGRPAERGREESPPERPAPRPRILSPWEILGVQQGASDAEIRRAFHRLAMRHHPDKVHHLGAEFEKMATRKFLELQRAFEALLRGR